MRPLEQTPLFFGFLCVIRRKMKVCAAAVVWALVVIMNSRSSQIRRWSGVCFGSLGLIDHWMCWVIHRPLISLVMGKQEWSNYDSNFTGTHSGGLRHFLDISKWKAFKLWGMIECRCFTEIRDVSVDTAVVGCIPRYRCYCRGSEHSMKKVMQLIFSKEKKLIVEWERH